MLTAHTVCRAADYIYKQLSLLRLKPGAGGDWALPYAQQLSNLLSSAIRFQMRRAFNTLELEDEEDEEDEGEEPATAAPAPSQLQSSLSAADSADLTALVAEAKHAREQGDSPTDSLSSQEAQQVMMRAASVAASSVGGIGRTGDEGSRWVGFLPTPEPVLSYNADDVAAIVHTALKNLAHGREAAGWILGFLPSSDPKHAGWTLHQRADNATAADLLSAMEFCRAHRFLLRLLTLPATLQAATGDGDCWTKLRRLAGLAGRYACVDEEHLAAFADPTAFIQQLQQQEPFVEPQLEGRSALSMVLRSRRNRAAKAKAAKAAKAKAARVKATKAAKAAQRRQAAAVDTALNCDVPATAAPGAECAAGVAGGAAQAIPPTAAAVLPATRIPEWCPVPSTDALVVLRVASGAEYVPVPQAAAAAGVVEAVEGYERMLMPETWLLYPEVAEMEEGEDGSPVVLAQGVEDLEDAEVMEADPIQLHMTISTGVPQSS